MNFRLWFNKKRFGFWRFYGFDIYGNGKDKCEPFRVHITLMTPFSCFYQKTFWRKYLRIFILEISWSRLNEKKTR